MAKRRTPIPIPKDNDKASASSEEGGAVSTVSPDGSASRRQSGVMESQDSLEKVSNSAAADTEPPNPPVSPATQPPRTSQSGTMLGVGNEEEEEGSQSGFAKSLIGRLIDRRYEVEKHIGEGGMGQVFRAKHVALNRHVALKILRSDMGRTSETIKRFRQEAQTASSIGNKHIIDVMDFGVLEDGATYFVMEYLDGSDLSDVIEKEKHIDVTRMVGIALQLCQALGAAHDVGIIHRDLKPDNVFLVEREGVSDFVKVLDFGIAKVAEGGERLTRAGQIFGTPEYMSPEQCSGSAVDGRADVYSLGVMMYEMVTGKLPFTAANAMGVLTQQMYSAPESPRRLTPALLISPEIESVILRCLAKDPDVRYESMSALAADLTAVAQGLTSDSLKATLAGRSRYLSTGEQQSVSGTQRWLMPLALGGVISAGLLAGWVFHASNRNPPPAPVPVAVSPEVVTAAQPVVPVVEAPAVTPRIEIVSEPAGAAIMLDGSSLGAAPAHLLRPEAGEEDFTVSVELDGYRSERVLISRRSAEVLRVVLERAPSTRSRGSSAPRRGGAAGGAPRPGMDGTSMRSSPAMMGELINPWAQ